MVKIEKTEIKPGDKVMISGNEGSYFLAETQKGGGVRFYPAHEQNYLVRNNAPGFDDRLQLIPVSAPHMSVGSVPTNGLKLVKD